MTALPYFLSWLTTLFHPQCIIDNLIFICFGLFDSSSVSHFPLILFFIWAVPAFLLHTTSLQTKFSLFLCFFWLVTSSHFLLNVLCCCFCYLMIIYLIFSPCPHFSHWLSVSPRITRSPLPPCQQQAPWLPPLLLHLTFDYSSTGATNAVTWQHQRTSHSSSTFSDLVTFFSTPKMQFLEPSSCSPLSQASRITECQIEAFTEYGQNCDLSSIPQGKTKL